jgi:hypothetical protein
MSPSWILAYYSIDLFAFLKSRQFLNHLTDPFKIWWPFSDLQGLLSANFKFSKIQDGGRLAAILDF